MSNVDIETLVERARYSGPNVTAEQLVGVDSCLRQLSGQLALFARPQLAQRFGLEPSGTLFIGPPGTGKTLMARYLAGRLEIPLYQLSADELGDDPDNVHGLFRRLAGQRAALFIDEISLIARAREWASIEDRRMLAALLTCLDGLPSRAGPDRLWVIGACTPDVELDRALYRAGRLGVVIEFVPPSQAQRLQLFHLYLAPVPHAVTDEQLSSLAAMANGATGADVRDWVSQAASEVLADASSTEDPVIEHRHLEAVVARRGFIASERPEHDPTWEMAVHEAGHAIVCHALFGRDALASVQLGFMRRGRNFAVASVGHFEVSDEWFERHPPTSATWPEHVAVHLAGACAEELLLGYRGAGAELDVGAATRAILQQLNEGDHAFGPSRESIEGSSGPMGGASVGSEMMRRLAWRLTRERFESCWLRASAVVTERREQIEHLARVLLQSKNLLSGDEILAAIAEGREAGQSKAW